MSEKSPPPYTLDIPPPDYQDLPSKKVELPPYPESESETSHAEPRDLRFHAFFVRRHLTSQELGTDSVFILCFFVCFLFNWIGYLLCFCLFNSVAARCGAISGVGLSLVKLLIILKRCTFDNSQIMKAREYIELHEVQYMVMMSLGLLVVFFGVLRYNSAKSAFLNRNNEGY